MMNKQNTNLFLSLFTIQSNICHMSRQQSKLVFQYFTQSIDPHLFQLKAFSSFCREQDIEVDFSPVKALELQQDEPKFVNYSIIPTFNNDGRFYSSAFLNPYEGLEGDKRMKSQHQTKVKEYSTQIASHQIMLPKPRSISHCYVCKQGYSDYLQHIQSSRHMVAVRKSKFHGFIIEMINKVNLNEKESVALRKSIRKKKKK